MQPSIVRPRIFNNRFVIAWTKQVSLCVIILSRKSLKLTSVGIGSITLAIRPIQELYLRLNELLRTLSTLRSRYLLSSRDVNRTSGRNNVAWRLCSERISEGLLREVTTTLTTWHSGRTTENFIEGTHAFLQNYTRSSFSSFCRRPSEWIIMYWRVSGFCNPSHAIESSHRRCRSFWLLIAHWPT